VVNPSFRETALYYCVDDLPGANVGSSRLLKILDRLRFGRPITQYSLGFLQEQGLEALHRLATGVLAYDSFRELALVEQAVCVEAATPARLAREAEERTRLACEAEERARAAARLARMKQAEAARLVRERDPKYIARIKLLARYGIGSVVKQHCFGQLMKILNRVDADQRLSQADFVWLSTVGKQYFSNQLRTDYHRLEADFFASEFKKTRDPWMAVNASGQYRKCNRSHDADSLLGTINVDQQKSTKLKSAICTTCGGVKRDLRRWDEALRLGEKAHTLKADDYRPCTLLGAIHMEIGNYNLGQEWYAKAVERGATVDSVDQDLRNIFFRADKAKQAEIREFLLSEDPVRYAWVTPRGKTHNRRPQF